MDIWRRVLAIAVICMTTLHVTAENTYMFVLPRTIRPGIPLPVRGTILKANVAPVSVTASLKRIQEKPNDISTVVAETSQMFTGSEELRLDIMVPQDLGSGTYEIQIEGKGRVSFKNSRSISYEPKSTSVFIQTDKAIYKPGQTVHFRILAVNPDLKVVKGPMDIELYDPSGNKINQWKGVEDPSGVFEGQQIMSDQPILGDWKITVAMNKMKDEKTFTVDEYVLPKFEVTVDLPSFGLTTDKMFKGSITAKYTFGKPVKGKVNLRIKSKYNSNIWRNGQMINAPVIEKTFPIDGKASFEVTMKELTEIDSSLDSSYLTFEANVTETLTGITQSGSGEVQFFDVPIKLEFPESLPKVFKPGMIYKAFLKVSQRDGLPPVNPQGKVSVTVTHFTPRPKQITEPPFEPFLQRRWFIRPPLDDEKTLPPLLLDIPNDGVISFPLDIPVNVKRVSMQVK